MRHPTGRFSALRVSVEALAASYSRGFFRLDPKKPKRSTLRRGGAFNLAYSVRIAPRGPIRGGCRGERYLQETRGRAAPLCVQGSGFVPYTPVVWLEEKHQERWTVSGTVPVSFPII